MKHFKLLSLIIITAMLSSCGLNRMVKNYEEVNYEVSPEVLENEGGTVALEVKGYIPEKYFHPKATVEVQPVLKYEDGEKKLTPFKLKGEKVQGEGTEISKKEGGSFTYSTAFEYKPAMKNSTLVTSPVASLKGKSETLGTTTLAKGIIITSTKIKNTENVALAPHMYEKETIVSEDATIYFAQNFANLNWWLDLNRDRNTKEKLAALKDFIRKGWEIKKIDLDAWASPEGELDFNEELAVDRAETGKKYLSSELNEIAEEEDSKVGFESADDVKLDIQPRGEDWNGFMEAVKESNIKEKNTILNVVRSQPNLKKREQEIRNMAMVYKEVAEKILPPLRRVKFTVNCYEPKFTDSQIKDLVFSNPDKLELNEMLYAATMYDDNDKKLQIYNMVTDKHAKCWRAHNNKAAIHLLKGELDEAEESLEEAKGDKVAGEVYKNMGVLASKKGNFDKAIQMFEKAQEKGLKANYNLGIAHIIKGDFDKAINLFGNTTCDYNLALAQVMNGNLNKAESTLKCADEDARTHYLLAVVGARKENKNMAMKHLKKATNMDSSLKAEAADDEEFIEYFTDSEFKNIVK